MKITTQRLEIHPMCQAEWRDILELFRVSLGSRNGISAICFTASGTVRAMPRKQRGR